MQAEKEKCMGSLWFLSPLLCKLNVYNTWLVFTFTLHTQLTRAHFSHQQCGRTNVPVKGILLSYTLHQYCYWWGSRHSVPGPWGVRWGRKPPSLVLGGAGWSLQNGLFRNCFNLLNCIHVLQKTYDTSTRSCNAIFAVQCQKLAIHPKKVTLIPLALSQSIPEGVPEKL